MVGLMSTNRDYNEILLCRHFVDTRFIAASCTAAGCLYVPMISLRWVHVVKLWRHEFVCGLLNGTLSYVGLRVWSGLSQCRAEKEQAEQNTVPKYHIEGGLREDGVSIRHRQGRWSGWFAAEVHDSFHRATDLGALGQHVPMPRTHTTSAAYAFTYTCAARSALLSVESSPPSHIQQKQSTCVFCSSLYVVRECLYFTICVLVITCLLVCEIWYMNAIHLREHRAESVGYDESTRVGDNNS